MKNLTLLFLTIFLASCVTTGEEQLDKMEEMLLAQNEMLTQVQEDLGRLESPAQKGEEPVEQEAVNVTTYTDYTLGDKIVVGDQEMIFVDPPGEYFQSRIDTGATTSSIHATDIEWFERDGKEWVRFNMNHDGKDRIMEKRVVEIREVRQSSKPEPVQRPVVSLHASIAGVETDVDFTLADRGHMTFPVLIGRNFIKDLMVVDVAYEYIHKSKAE